jgi:hypothetical protein
MKRKKALAKKSMKKARGGTDPITAARFELLVNGKSIGSFDELQKLAGQAGSVDHIDSSDDPPPLLRPKPLP